MLAFKILFHCLQIACFSYCVHSHDISDGWSSILLLDCEHVYHSDVTSLAGNGVDHLITKTQHVFCVASLSTVSWRHLYCHL